MKDMPRKAATPMVEYLMMLIACSGAWTGSICDARRDDDVKRRLLGDVRRCTAMCKILLVTMTPFHSLAVVSAIHDLEDIALAKLLIENTSSPDPGLGDDGEESRR